MNTHKKSPQYPFMDIEDLTITTINDFLITTLYFYTHLSTVDYTVISMSTFYNIYL